MKATLKPIKNMSDAGLRRSYLHKNPFRKSLIYEWLKYAPDHAVSGEQMVDFVTQIQMTGRLDEVFERLLAAGVRLNAQLDPALLPDEIVQEVEELTGAEYIALVLVDDKGGRTKLKTQFPLNPFPGEISRLEVLPDPQAFLTGIEGLLDEAITTRQGFIRYLNPNGALIDQCSILIAPLISQNNIVGVIYCGIQGCFGRFVREDLNLLSVLANQSAVAVENAEWAATLEKKVASRTNELKRSNDHLAQRTDELTIINRVQEGLTRHLDFQAIIDLVGDELMRVFPAPKKNASKHMAYIALYDSQTNLIRFPYFRNGTGECMNFQPLKVGEGLTSIVIQSRQPLVIRSWEEGISNGAVVLDGESSEDTQSWLGVPILTGEMVTGAVGMTDPRRGFFTQADARLLSTIAASLGTALENARLFDETERLLNETEQHAAELAKSNKIQTALFKITDAASNWEDEQDFFREIHRVIGELMYARNLFIALYDEPTGLLSFPYFEDEKDQPFPTQPLVDFHGVTSYMIRTGNSLRHGLEEWDQLIATGEVEWVGTPNEDNIGAPLISDGKAIGAIMIQSYSKGVNFTEQDSEVLEFVAQHIATALTRRRALEAERQRNAELEILNEVSDAMVKLLDVKSITRIVGDKVRDIFDVDSAMIMLLDPQTNLIHSYYEYDKDEGGYIDYVEPFPLGTGLASKVISTRQPLLLNTLEEEIANGAYFPPEIIKENASNFGQSWVGVPIVTGEAILGLIAISDYRPQAFNEKHLRLLQTVASNVGVVIENARLYQAEQQRAAELAIINSVQAGLAAQLDMQAIYELVGEKIRQIFDANVVVLATFDLDNNLMHRHYEIERGERFYHAEPMPIPKIWMSFIQAGQLLWVRNNFLEAAQRIDPEFMAIQGEVPKCTVTVPIKIQGKLYGAISLQNVEHEDAFSESDVRLLETLANSLSVALENARLFEETQRLLKETEQRAAELAIINSIQAGLASQLNMQAIYELVGEKIREIFAANTVVLATFDLDKNLMYRHYEIERGERFHLAAMPIPDYWQHFIQQDRTFLINDHLLEFMQGIDARFKVPVGEVPKCSLSVPIRIKGKLQGVISLQNVDRENAFNENDQHLLETLANSLSVALENARLFDETQLLLKETEQHAAELAAVNTVGSALASELDLEALIQLVGEQTRYVFKADIAFVALLDESENSISFPYTFGEQLPSMQLGEGLTSRIIQTRQPLLINKENDRQTLEIGPTVIGKHAQSFLGVPIIVSGKAVGVLSVQSCTQEGMFEQDDVRLLSTIAASVGTAIHNAQLYQQARQSRAEAEQANSAKSVFLANMSHELRTPLNAIIGFTRIVRRKSEGILPEKQVENLDKVLISAENLLGLINSVLDIAKIEAGRMDVVAANFRIAALIDLCANTAQPLLLPGVTLEKVLDEKLEIVHSDQDKIRQIVLNLLSNAAKFTREGKITITAMRVGEQDLRIAVSDTGIGISEEALPRIFKEFEQADTTTTRKYGGTGLGLTISRNLARLLGGDLTAQSVQGEGSTFTLTVPIQYHSKMEIKDEG